MSDRFLSTIAALTKELSSQARDQERLGVLARSLRWQRPLAAHDLEALLALGELVKPGKDPGGWEVERAVLEILCEQAEVEHVPFLVRVFRHKARGKHSDDRRRLALHALSNVAARTGDEEALLVLEEGLNHYKKDTRGWAIGFLLDSYTLLGRALPQPVIARLRLLAENDVGPDVRVEATLALARLGLADAETVTETMAASQAQAGQEGKH